MTIERSRKGRGLFYYRDSGGKHDQSLPEYVGWAVRRSAELGIAFDGTPERMTDMVRTNRAVSGDLLLDYCVSGNTMSRPALNQLRGMVEFDLTISHLLIVRRDRLFRPDDPTEALQWETDLRCLGVTIVYMDQILEPLVPGQRVDLGQQIMGMVEYDKTGRFREELAKKMIHAHAGLAKQGFSTGGRAPYGFRRWLMDASGTPVRELTAGEVVRHAGHHVCWLPGPNEELSVIHRILDLIRTVPATRIAKILNAEGIPSPDSERTRKDSGRTHEVSGLWHSTTITNIVRKSLMIAETAYGQRSMGDQVRHSLSGPRLLGAADRDKDGKPKVIQNPKTSIIHGKGKFEPLIAQEKHEELIEILDKRGGKQRGKPRSRNSGENPLDCRIFDQACSSVMYRTPRNGTFRYECGLYQQSHGQRCSCNHIDGMTATRFALAAVQQQICSPVAKDKIAERLRKRAQAEADSGAELQIIQNKRLEFERIEKDLKKVSRNLALAEDECQFRDISAVQKGLQAEKMACELEIAKLERQSKSRLNVEDEIAAILNSMGRLSELASESSNLPAIGKLFTQVNLRLYLRFMPVQKKKRIENKLVSGVLVMGAGPAPITEYSGPTSRAALKLPKSHLVVPTTTKDAEPNCSGLEDKSLGNVNRDDRI
ncbi:MAG: Resolvase domain protein [Planctomycetaceae bacterium]|nr:Resolvase domain protein [Planctomycetaceae bacterium]